MSGALMLQAVRPASGHDLFGEAPRPFPQGLAISRVRGADRPGPKPPPLWVRSSLSFGKNTLKRRKLFFGQNQNFTKRRDQSKTGWAHVFSRKPLAPWGIRTGELRAPWGGVRIRENASG